MSAASRRSHAKRRAYERYGLELEDADLADIAKRCRYAKVIRRQGQSSILLLNYHGLDVYIVYNYRNRDISTFLTLEMILNEDGKIYSIWDLPARGSQTLKRMR